jgi:prevent-host-death family protein
MKSAGRDQSRRGRGLSIAAGVHSEIDLVAHHHYLLSSYLARMETMGGGQWSLQDAKNHFSEVVEAASQGTPQTVTKRGKPTVVVLSVTDYERLNGKSKDRPSFAEHLLAFPTGKGNFRFEGTKIKLRNVKF